MEFISYDLEVNYKFMKLRKVIGAEVLILFQWRKTDLGIIQVWTLIEYSFYHVFIVIIHYEFY